MIELEHSLGLNGLPTAKCAEHGLVLRPEASAARATLVVTWSCPICKAEEWMRREGSSSRSANSNQDGRPQEGTNASRGGR